MPPKEGPKEKWHTLRHAGVLFPPEYKPHSVPLTYKGKKIKLTPEQEEVATMYAAMLETEYVKKPVFRANFWTGFKEVLGPKHAIKDLDGCDFTAIHDHLVAERERKNTMTKEEKKAAKEAKDAEEAQYKVAYVDGKPEPVGNFRVEPPGLFRGRGAHPKMGVIKKRVYPKDIVINIGKGEPVPKHPYKGQMWKEVVHDRTATWLARWNDTVSPKDLKYVFLGATSTFKADSDQAKYEKARELKKMIGRVRANYERDFSSSDRRKRQMATAIYLIDRLALRAGHEKGEDEADTVGTCTLKCDHVKPHKNGTITLDFLGKDSIRYENTVKVDAKVFANIKEFITKGGDGRKKKPGDFVFDTFDATDLNKELKNIMDGLSAKVFRTYNASSTLDRLLHEKGNEGIASKTKEEKKAIYDAANKDVAVLCNHQRAVPKTHTGQVERLKEKMKEVRAKIKELEASEKKTKEAQIERQKEQLKKLRLQLKSKEELKQVALGTSKINYLDPRITVSWCKRNEMPIEKVFNKALLDKFGWAMEEPSTFKF